MTVLNIIPNQGVDKGGNDVHVRGHNFPSSTNNIYKCMFDTYIVDGIWVARNHVICPAPKHSEGHVTLEISVDGIEYTNNKVFILSIVFFYFEGKLQSVEQVNCYNSIHCNFLFVNN
jgi:hypothetical protein